MDEIQNHEWAYGIFEKGMCRKCWSDETVVDAETPCSGRPEGTGYVQAGEHVV